LAENMRLLVGKRLSFAVCNDGTVEGLVGCFQLHVLLTQYGTAHITFTQTKETAYALDVVSKLLELEPGLEVPEWADFIVADFGFDVELRIGEFATLRGSNLEFNLAIVHDLAVCEKTDGCVLDIECRLLNPGAVTRQIISQDLGNLARVVCAKLGVPAPPDAWPAAHWDLADLPLVWYDLEEPDDPHSPFSIPASPQRTPPPIIEPVTAFCLSAKRNRAPELEECAKRPK
jgi:hypothetical protein